jgi:hypothetical protein
MKIGAILAGAVALATTTSAAFAQTPKDFPEVTDTSFVQANGDKVLQLSLTVPAARADVWRRISTGEGYQAWAAPVATVDARLGGIIEDSYDPNARIGDPDNIRNQIVVFSPGRVLAVKNVQAPAALPGRKEFADITTIIELDDAGSNSTRVTLTATGYKPGEPYDTLYRHFSWGNAYSLMELKTSFVKGPIDWKARAAQTQAKAAAAKVQEPH